MHEETKIPRYSTTLTMVGNYAVLIFISLFKITWPIREAKQINKGKQFFFIGDTSRITLLAPGSLHDALFDMLLICCTLDFPVCFGFLTECRTLIFPPTFSIHFIVSFLTKFNFLPSAFSICSGALKSSPQLCQ